MVVRRPSIVAAAERRKWIMVSSWLVCTIFWVMTLFCFHFTTQMTVLSATLLVCLGLTAADVRAYRRLRRLEARPLPTGVPLRPAQAGVPIVDVGIGLLQHEEREPGAPYRGDDRLRFVVRGNPTAGRIRLGCILSLDFQSILLVLLLMLFTIGFAATKMSVLGGHIPGE
jgi:hypothetical protein